MGAAVFGAIFTSRLSGTLNETFSTFGASTEHAGEASTTISTQVLEQLPTPLQDAIVTAYTDSLAPVLWYLIPCLAIALIVAIILKEMSLSETAGMVARGEAIGGEDAERMELNSAAPATTARLKPSLAGRR